MTVITQGGVVLDDKENRLLDQAIKILELEARVAQIEANEAKLEAKLDRVEKRVDYVEESVEEVPSRKEFDNMKETVAEKLVEHAEMLEELKVEKLEAHEEMMQNLDERIAGISKASIKCDNEIKIVIAATASAAASKPGAAKEQTLVAHAKELEELKEKLEAHEEMLQNLDKQL